MGAPSFTCLVLVIIFLFGCQDVNPPQKQAEARSILDALSADQADLENYARVRGPRDYEFPKDHGPHPRFRTEWWYLTGHLTDLADGREYGFQFTVFRTALSPKKVSRKSAWATHDNWMAHFALSDVKANKHVSAELFSRDGNGLAGASSKPFRVFVGPWSMAGTQKSLFPWELSVQTKDIDLRLAITSQKPLVLQGDRGFSAKGPEIGNASHYLSFTRLSAEGELTQGTRSFAVQGEAWMDHEWSTSALSPDLVGWDWFSLQLNDGRELMLYSLRRKDGSSAPASAGTIVQSDGRSRPLSPSEFGIELLDHWTSTKSQITYPSQWRLTVPSEQLDLVIEPVINDQEMRLAVIYWEGAVRVRGDGAAGRGFVELVGYAK